MTVRIEKSGSVWTIIHSRPESRNAMDFESAKALYEAFLEFEDDHKAAVAVFWGEGGAFCAGWDLKHAAVLEELEPLSDLTISQDDGGKGNGSDIPMGAMGPSRLELDKPVDVTSKIVNSGVPEVDGEVRTPFELIERLAGSTHCEQVFVRYVFRFFMGRNETLGDAKSLQEAHKAYVDNDGSMESLVLSLLSSDSFLYRAKPVSLAKVSP